jgi:hypothetical protein
MILFVALLLGISSPDATAGNFTCVFQNFVQALVLKTNSFKTTRRFQDYQEELGSQFVEAVRNLGPGAHWIDAGAGEAGALGEYTGLLKVSELSSISDLENSDGKLVAIRDHYTGALYKLPPFDQRAKVTAVAYNIPHDARASVHAMIAQAPDRFRYLSGHYIEDMPASELGQADLITDQFGPLTYSKRVDEVLDKYLEVLKKNGQIFTFNYSRTTIKTSKGLVTLEDWLKSFDGTDVEVNIAHSGAIQIKKLTDRPFRFPRLRLVKIDMKIPPFRTFEVVE